MISYRWILGQLAFPQGSTLCRVIGQLASPSFASRHWLLVIRRRRHWSIAFQLFWRMQFAPTTNCAFQNRSSPFAHRFYMPHALQKSGIRRRESRYLSTSPPLFSQPKKPPVKWVTSNPCACRMPTAYDERASVRQCTNNGFSRGISFIRANNRV